MWYKVIAAKLRCDNFILQKYVLLNISNEMNSHFTGQQAQRNSFYLTTLSIVVLITDNSACIFL